MKGAGASVMLDCSIVIVTYNGWPLLRECLLLLEPQLLPGIGVTIVDNGSSDGLPERVRSSFGWVNLIETRRNLGFAAGNNLGISRTQSEFVLLLNSDVFVRPGFVEAMLQTFDREPRIGAVAGTLVFRTNPSLVASAGIDVFTNGLALDRSLGDDVTSLQERQRVFGASAGAAAYRREALEDAGSFPESFFMYLEDVDLAWRLRLRGWESVLAASAMAEHAYSASSGEGSRMKRRLLARNRIWHIARCYPSWLLARTWWRMALYDLMVVSSAPVRRDAASVTGRIAALSGMTARLRERRAIQARTTAEQAEIECWLRTAPSPSRLMQLRDLTRAYAVTES
jgi:GT2 family glycosyltransferase